MALSRDDLLQYLKADLRVDTSAIEDTTPLFSSGTIDSFAIVELMLFLEKSTGAKLSPDEITLDNLDTVQQILEFAAARTVG